MIFDKKQVIDGVKLALMPKEKVRSGAMNLALGLCLDDMCMRLKSTSFLEVTTESMTAGDRTITLAGANNDLRYIFSLKLAASTNGLPLERKDQKIFLRDHDDPNAEAGEPTFYTVLTSDYGKPTVKFDRPLQTDDTLTVYYFSDMTPENITKARSVAAAVAGTTAYFFGIKSDRGAPYYDSYRELVMLARASDNFESIAPSGFQMSDADRQIYNVLARIKQRRS